MDTQDRPPVAYQKLDSARVSTTSPKGQHAGQSVQWGVNIQAPSKICFLFGSGVLFAALHHWFYSWLDDKETTGWKWATQEWLVRFGTAFAFLTKTLLAGAIALSYKQRVWMDMRKRYYTVSALNAIYSATDDFFALFSWESVRKTKVASLLALLTWCVPLSALIAPATLVIRSSVAGTSNVAFIPTLNLYNMPVDDAPPDIPPLLTRITTAASSNGAVLPMATFGSSKSYTIVFNASSWSCDRITNSTTLVFIDSILNEMLHQASLELGMKTLVYFAVTPLNYYADRTEEGGYNTTDLIDSCMAGDSECYYSPDLVMPEANFTLLARFNSESWGCSAQETLYTVHFNSSGSTQTIPQVLERNLVGPTRHPVSLLLASLITEILTGIYSTIVDTSDEDCYKLQTNYARTTIYNTPLVGLLETPECTPGQDPPTEFSSNERLTQNKSFGTLVEELSINQTLSFFSDPRLLANDVEKANVTNTEPVNRYQYKRQNLLLAYGLAIFATFGSVVIGIHAIYANGVYYDTDFFTAMATTRNPELDNLTVGSSLGSGTSIGKGISATKLKFGVIGGGSEGADGMPRAAFGLEGQVSELKKGATIS